MNIQYSKLYKSKDCTWTIRITAVSVSNAQTTSSNEPGEWDRPVYSFSNLGKVKFPYTRVQDYHVNTGNHDKVSIL